MINYLEHHIVDHCNLNCARCSHFSPIAEPWFEDIEDFKKDFGTLSEKTNGNVGIIRLMGGEPLLHPDVGDFLIQCRELFPRTQIQLVTNGLLLKKRKEELINIINDNNIVVCISNYHINIDFDDIKKSFRLVRIDEKAKMYNISLDLSGKQDIENSFNNCDLHIYHFYYFQKGRFYPCCIGANIESFEKKFNLKFVGSETDERSISIYENSITDVLKFLEKPISLCKYCNTTKRNKSYYDFSISKGDISEWTYQ